MSPSDTVSPTSRSKLYGKARSHAEHLSTTVNQIPDQHRVATQRLVDWMTSKYFPGRPLEIIVVCTGNSRRSILGSSMGNLAAAYYGKSEVRFYSGGTTPSAFNPRTIAALVDIGIEIEAMGTEAKRGDEATPNPKYRVRWGEGLEAIEFSKHYGDACNPQSDFGALLVCTEADEGCPFVAGASLRLPMPFQDPKSYDDTPLESTKYAERRDEIGRTLFWVMDQFSRNVAAANTIPS